MNTSAPTLNASREHAAMTSSGYLMLMVMLVTLIVGVVSIPLFGAVGPAIAVLCAIAFILIIKGFYMLQPNQAAAITLFGSYKGTDRAHGLRWVWPWMGKTKVSTRANNMISDTLKV